MFVYLQESSNLSSQEKMENLLNGKNLDDIEFRPSPTKAREDEFHFGPNASPFTAAPIKPLDQCEVVSTTAVSDHLVQSVPETEAPKQESDPMVTSFYEEKAADIDLNKVHKLPDDLDNFLEKPTDISNPFDDTISDLPDHNPLEGMVSGATHVAGSPDLIPLKNLDLVFSEVSIKFDYLLMYLCID